ncbi:MAG: ATP-binding cassette domain-containing protein [Marinilabiliales bacterium]|nr:MAG: ATP-binding cassette domain-containing protein [Marinilabiliales bacterium]
MGKIVELKNVSAGYTGEVILREVNLVVNDHDFIGIIGPNGGGKTTLLKVVLGLIRPYKGSVTFFNGRESSHGNIIGYLPQINLIDTRFPISVTDVVLSGLMSKEGILGRYSGKQKKLALETLEKMGIHNLRDKTVGELSGGQLQRVYLCRAIISSPRLLMLDEPSTFVDTKFETDFYEILKELNDDMAIIVVSHDVGTITWYVKTIACVNRDLHYHPHSTITQEQLAAYNCPIQIITHGDVPHTVLKTHNH